MKQLRQTVIRAGFDALSLTGAHRLLRPWLAGAGAIFMLHHVRPARDTTFQPNRHLEITPDFLRAVLAHVRGLGADIVTLDEMRRRLASGDLARRFACFTFDDGYRDNRDHALAVMRAFDAPFTVFVTSDFASHKGRLWWLALERVVASADAVEAGIGGNAVRLDAATPEAKQAAFARLHDALRDLPDDAAVNREVAALCARHGVEEDAISRELCMSWDELKSFAADPLVSIGAHTLTHGNLAHQDEAAARHELAANRTDIEAALQRPVAHLAYPYGDRNAAAAREFALAREAGFTTAVTTRPGMVFAEHAAHLTALPRISLNGNFQGERFLSVLTSGAATALWNGFRRLDVN
jgi:peptidoglycan/xylan/chitin deacetylase (PgdA/CDA1 family)